MVTLFDGQDSLWHSREKFLSGNATFPSEKKTSLVKALSDRFKYGIIRKFLWFIDYLIFLFNDTLTLREKCPNKEFFSGPYLDISRNVKAFDDFINK